MKALAVVDAGVCGFQSRIHAESDEMQNVTFRIVTPCEKVRAFSETLTAAGPVDGYTEIGEGSAGVILTAGRAHMKGCCAACAVPVGTYKVMQVVAGLALPKDVSIQLKPE